MAHFAIDGHNMSEKSWKKAKKRLKRSVVLKRSNWTNILNWKQVSNMIRHKKYLGSKAEVHQSAKNKNCILKLWKTLRVK